MHEWALAEAVLTTVLDIAAKENAEKILEIDIVMGELQQIDMETFKFALENLVKGTIAENARIVFETEKAVLKCNVCGYEWSFGEIIEKLDEEAREAIHFIPEVFHAYIACPVCGSRDFDVVRGRGVYIKSIKVLGGGK